MPALPRVDNALRLASEAALQESLLTTFLGLRLSNERAILGAAAMLAAVLSTASRLLPLQPHPQSLSDAGDAATVLASLTLISVRVRSVLATAVLPPVDMALRRASDAERLLLEATLTLLLPIAAGLLAAACGAGVTVALTWTLAGDVAAEDLALAAEDEPNADLPELDNALRLASARARLLLPCVFAVCAISILAK
jgi:hypothetical protein